MLIPAFFTTKILLVRIVLTVVGQSHFTKLLNMVINAWITAPCRCSHLVLSVLKPAIPRIATWLPRFWVRIPSETALHSAVPSCNTFLSRMLTTRKSSIVRAPVIRVSVFIRLMVKTNSAVKFARIGLLSIN